MVIIILLFIMIMKANDKFMSQLMVIVVMVFLIIMLYQHFQEIG